MKITLVPVISLLVVLAACGTKQDSPEQKSNSQVIVPDKPMTLWNGKNFSGFGFYLEDPNVDPRMVWTIKDDVIHCTGVPAGYMFTDKEYGNYRLLVEWRWSAEPGNSGVLLHKTGIDTVWPKSIEAQLMAENAGDFYLIGGTTMNEQTDKSKRRVQKKQESSEKPAGEWNTYDITCKDDTIILVVNNVLQNSASGASVTAGKICLQSEGKPIEFRKIFLEPLE